MLTICTRVSRQWRDLVYRKEFIPWKKSYYKYKIDQTYVKLLDKINPNLLENFELFLQNFKISRENGEGQLLKRLDRLEIDLGGEDRVISIVSNSSEVKSKKRKHENSTQHISQGHEEDEEKEHVEKRLKLETKKIEYSDISNIEKDVECGEANFDDALIKNPDKKLFCDSCKTNIPNSKLELLRHIRDLSHIKNNLSCYLVKTRERERVEKLLDDSTKREKVEGKDATITIMVEDILYEKSILFKSLEMVDAIYGWDKKNVEKFKFQNNFINKENCLQEITRFEVGKIRLEFIIPWLVQFVSKSFSSKSHFFKYIEKHPRYEEALQCLHDIMEEDSSVVPNEHKYPGIIVILCCVANTAWDVLSILNLVLHSNSTCNAHDATELFYCIALAFLYFKRNYTELPSRYHYNRSLKK